MPDLIECSTQAQVDAATAAGNIAVVRAGFVRASGSATVRASGSATVRASGSATVEAYGSATVRAYDSATVEAYDSATVRAYGSATVRASGSATVEASKFNAVVVHSPNVHVNGGVLLTVPQVTTAAEWCEFYGIEPTDGMIIVYKAVNDQYTTDYGVDYSPGSTPEAADFDPSPSIECGQGLHFGPTPHHARRYNATATRFLACPVALKDVAVHAPGYPLASPPDKIRARRVCAPVYEVDEDGNRLVSAEAGVA